MNSNDLSAAELDKSIARSIREKLRDLCDGDFSPDEIKTLFMLVIAERRQTLAEERFEAVQRMASQEEPQRLDDRRLRQYLGIPEDAEDEQ